MCLSQSGAAPGNADLAASSGVIATSTLRPAHRRVWLELETCFVAPARPVHGCCAGARPVNGRGVGWLKVNELVVLVLGPMWPCLHLAGAALCLNLFHGMSFLLVLIGSVAQGTFLHILSWPGS